MDEQRTERLIEMMRWLLENPACVRNLCGLDEPTGRDLEDVLERLEKQGYYEYILLLLAREHDDMDMYRAIAQYLADRLGRSLRENGIQGELAVFKALLAQQLSACKK